MSTATAEPVAQQAAAPKTRTKGKRRQQILQSLAEMLQDDPTARITTAKLADKVGVSEAALYRHFPSKARMYESLIEFIEETLFSRIRLILNDEKALDARCGRILALLLTFCARNPGLTRILTRDALSGEHARLIERIGQVYDRIETQLKQILREAEMQEGVRPAAAPALLANLMLSFVEGRLQQFVRSDFKRSPLEGWEEQWNLVRYSLIS